METICDCLASDHRRCGDLFSEIENNVTLKEWTHALESFQRFDHALTRHLQMEETVLFPTVQKTLHHSTGPVAMLQQEHQRLRGMAWRIDEALCRCDAVDFLLHSETFTILMQEHSTKEEDMLYPLLERILSGNTDQIVQAMRAALATPITAQ